jgi:uncharacterized protein (TIGR00730 family)
MNKPQNFRKIRSICVYCGSSPGANGAYAQAARDFGEILAKNDIALVYGGGAIGIMGEISRTVVKYGGKVHGIIPEFLMARERALETPQGLIVTRDMHERKRRMFEMADAFVALPGGVGTLEELVEQLTWVQLGRHRKPVLVANVEGFWNPLCALFDHMRNSQFIRGELTFDLLVANKISEILPLLQKAVESVPKEAMEMTEADAEQL